jgi:hypothetical protein
MYARPSHRAVVGGVLVSNSAWSKISAEDKARVTAAVELENTVRAKTPTGFRVGGGDDEYGQVIKLDPRPKRNSIRRDRVIKTARRHGAGRYL